METVLAESPVAKKHAYAVQALYDEFGRDSFVVQICADDIPTLWIKAELLLGVMKFLKPRFCMLYDLFGIDERTRVHRARSMSLDEICTLAWSMDRLLHR